MHQTSTRSLEPAELQAYHDHGYVVIPEVLSRLECHDINQELDQLLDAHKQNAKHQGPAPGWIMSLGLSTPRMQELCADPRILALIRDIVKPGISIYSAKLVSKEAHDDHVCYWHQDDAYYAERCPSKTRMSIWLALQDIEPEHGCLEVVPGSHKHGLQESQFRPGGTCSKALLQDPPLADRVPCPIQAGSMILFSALLWHGSGPNPSDQRRRAFIVSYQEASCPCGNGDQYRIIEPAP